MIYTPQKHPRQTLMMITALVLTGILGGMFIDPFFMVVSLLFWIHYTAILAYLQIRHASRHDPSTLTGVLLNPFARLFIFETIAIIALVLVLVYDYRLAGVIALCMWEIFAVNFYIFYIYASRETFHPNEFKFKE
jgi:hypothetical protein